MTAVLDLAIYFAFPAAMALAAICDLTTMTIPNKLSLALVAVFPFAALATGMPIAAFGMHFLAGFIVLAAGILFFSRGWIGGGDAKLAAATAAGADLAIDHRSTDFVAATMDATAGRGVDVVYDPVGGELFAASLRSIAFEGRILVIGFAGGTVPQIPANHLLVKNVDVIGLNWPAYAERHPAVMTESFRTLMDWYLAGAIRPYVSAIYPLERAVDALDQVVARKSSGKVVIAVGG